MSNQNNYFQTSDGVWLYYEVRGGGKPLVVVPGFAGTTKYFADHAKAWSRKYKVVVFDPRSHGRSMKVSGSMRIERMAKDIRELIDHLELQDVVLIGHSLGGAQVAQYVNHEGAYRLRGAGLIDATLYGFGDEDWNEHKCRGHNMDMWLSRMVPYMNDPKGYWEKSLSAKKGKISEERYQELLNDLCALPAWAGAEMHLSVYHTDNFTPLKNCTIPMAFFTAHSPYHNAWRSHHEAMEQMTVCPLKAMYEFYGNDHGFPESEKEKFIDCVFDFMEKIDAFEREGK